MAVSCDGVPHDKTDQASALIDPALEGHEVSWRQIRGHAGYAENERADRLARDGMKPYLPKKDQAVHS